MFLYTHGNRGLGRAAAAPDSTGNGAVGREPGAAHARPPLPPWALSAFHFLLLSEPTGKAAREFCDGGNLVSEVTLTTKNRKLETMAAYFSTEKSRRGWPGTGEVDPGSWIPLLGHSWPVSLPFRVQGGS